MKQRTYIAIDLKTGALQNILPITCLSQNVAQWVGLFVRVVLTCFSVIYLAIYLLLIMIGKVMNWRIWAFWKFWVMSESDAYFAYLLRLFFGCMNGWLKGKSHFAYHPPLLRYI